MSTLINVKKWGKNGLVRWYLTDENGNDLGYVQQRDTDRAPGYYDSHRKAKGDSTAVAITAHGVSDAILAAISCDYQPGVINHSALSVAAGGTYIAMGKKGLQTRPATPIQVLS